jgi:hypothetical protein
MGCTATIIGDLNHRKGVAGPLFRISLAPPLALAETEDGPSRGPFFFWFQRGLGAATALRRLPKRAKSVSEPHLSLIDRPRPPEGRFKNSIKLQQLGDFGRASFSRVQPMAQCVANP